jgi:Tfp pilus assembly protein PilO
MHSAAGKHSKWSRIDAAGIGVCAVMSLLWYGITISPLLEQRSRTADLRHQIRDQQQKAEQLKVAVASVQQQLETVRGELSAGNIQLDSAAHINRRIAELTDFFTDCMLHIDDVQTGRISSGLQCDLVPITIVGRGAYPQCVRFLHGLCSRFPDMSVMRIEFRGTPARTTQAEQFRFEMFWYTAPNSAVRSAASAGTRHPVAFAAWGQME